VEFTFQLPDTLDVEMEDGSGQGCICLTVAEDVHEMTD
jgi:hypothetical protein